MNESISPSTKFNTLIDGYIEYYASGSTHTARAKRLDLHKFLDFLQEFNGYSKPEKITVKDWTHSAIQRFVDESLAIESPATVSRRLATIKHMGRTYAEKISGFTNPAKEIKNPKAKSAAPKALSPSEIKTIRKNAKNRINKKDSFIRYRNNVVFSFLLETGLRAEEIRLLRMSQLDEKLEWIKSVRTKGKRYRNVYVNSNLREILEEYLCIRQENLIAKFGKISKSIDKNLPIFISMYKSDLDSPKSFQMGAKTLWRAINELSTDTGLHPHLLRHTFALDLLKSSKDIRLVSQALGHGDVRITMRYTERSDIEVAEAIEKKSSNSE